MGGLWHCFAHIIAIIIINHYHYHIYIYINIHINYYSFCMFLLYQPLAIAILNHWPEIAKVSKVTVPNGAWTWYQGPSGGGCAQKLGGRPRKKRVNEGMENHNFIMQN